MTTDADGGVTKAALIEALAKELYDFVNGQFTWQDAEEPSQQNYRAVTEVDLLPLIVEFVAVWIERYTAPDGERYGELNADQWRLEMA